MLGKLESLDNNSLQDTLHWLVSRQTPFIDEDEEEDEYEVPGNAILPSQTAYEQLSQGSHIENPHHTPTGREMRLPRESSLPIELPIRKVEMVKIHGINGRCNKVADTCYSWWVGGTLGILKKVHLQDTAMNKSYLLEKMQHLVGGFSKLPGDAPGRYICPFTSLRKIKS